MRFGQVDDAKARRARLERVVAGMQSRKVITDHEKRVVAWHEAGH